MANDPGNKQHPTVEDDHPSDSAADGGSGDVGSGDVGSGDDRAHNETKLDDEAEIYDGEVSEADVLRSELEDANNQVLRAQAELDNFRKRARRDAQEQVKYATLPMMRELVDVLDNLTRAIEASEQSPDEGLRNGVKLVADQLQGVLESHDCKQIETVGQPFDPNLHESIRMVESDEHPSGTIVQEIQVGYHLHDRVIRPAKVFVAQ